MSPGTMRMRKKISTATPKSVGIIKSRRLMMYLVTPSRPLLGEPHRVELVVQVVAWRHRPAPELGAVRNDAVPLQRVEIVGLFVHQPALEVAQIGRASGR